MTNSSPTNDKHRAIPDGAVTDEIVNFAMLLGYDLRSMEGLQALRDDVEFVKRWRARTRNVSKLLIWAGGALISGLLAGLSGALLTSGHGLSLH
jgi:hypothetical protein